MGNTCECETNSGYTDINIQTLRRLKRYVRYEEHEEYIEYDDSKVNIIVIDEEDLDYLDK